MGMTWLTVNHRFNDSRFKSKLCGSLGRRRILPHQCSLGLAHLREVRPLSWKASVFEIKKAACSFISAWSWFSWPGIFSSVCKTPPVSTEQLHGDGCDRCREVCRCAHVGQQWKCGTVHSVSSSAHEKLQFCRMTNSSVKSETWTALFQEEVTRKHAVAQQDHSEHHAPVVPLKFEQTSVSRGNSELQKSWVNDRELLGSLNSKEKCIFLLAIATTEKRTFSSSK